MPTNEEIEETLEILNDPDTMDALADAERDVANGDLVEMEGLDA